MLVLVQVAADLADQVGGVLGEGDLVLFERLGEDSQ